MFWVMHTVNWDKPDFSVVMSHSRQVDSLVSRLRKTMVVKAKENQDSVPTMYWIPKLHIKQDLLLILVLYDNRTF